jgi:hypothetical protein
MRQITVVPSRLRMKFFTGRMFPGIALSVLICFLVLPPVSAAECDRVFERSGIQYPDGFDPNTVGELHGKVACLYPLAGASGLVIFDLETTWERYTVVMCSSWYWDELKAKVSVGEEVHVIGSKSLGKDSNLYIIAQKIHFIEQGKSVMLRDEAGTPLWDTQHGKTSSQQRSRDRIRGQH